MEKGNSSAVSEAEAALRSLEHEIGEPLLYRATGRFLGADGLGEVPRGAWGLLVLTPTRLVFRHFAQVHPLFGGKDGEVRWEVPRARFDACQPVLPTLWSKLFSGAVDHVALTGSGCRLALETADNPRTLPSVWNS